MIPAVSPTCTEHGYTEGIECSVCHEILTAPTEVPATGHSYGDWTIIKEATCTEEGLKQRTCTVCSTMEEEIIPMTEHDWESAVSYTHLDVYKRQPLKSTNRRTGSTYFSKVHSHSPTKF